MSRKCKGCGEEIPEDVAFCPKCGVRQNETSDREKNIDKLVANAASVSDDVSSVVSDAHNLIKFGKKLGKATVKEVTEKKEGASLKSRVVAALLSFFLGEIGAHSFYLGKKIAGVFHIILVIISVACWIYGAENSDDIIVLGMLVEAINRIWSIIAAIILILGCGKDGNGLPVKNWT